MSKDLAQQVNTSKLSVSQTAKILGISRSSLLRLEERNLIKSERLPNGYRVYNSKDVALFKESGAAHHGFGEIKQEQKTNNIANIPVVHENITQNIETQIINIGKYVSYLFKFSTASFFLMLGAFVFIDSLSYSKGVSGASVASSKSNTSLTQKQNDVLGIEDIARNYSFNITVPTNLRNNVIAFQDLGVRGNANVDISVSTPSLVLTGLGSISGLTTIDAPSETALERILDISGEVISPSSGGLSNVTIADGVIDEANLIDTIEYTGDWNFAGTWAVNGASITSTGDELNYLSGTTVTDGGILFGDGSMITENSLKLFWNDVLFRLGIGTNAPAYELDVVGTGRFSSGIISNNFYVNSDGHVGIGTSLPQASLDLNGAMRFAQTTSPSTTTDKLYNLSGSLYWAGNLLNSPAGVLPTGSTNDTIRYNGTTWLPSSLISNNGTYVGIGTTVPTNILDIAGGVKIGVSYAGMATTAPSSGLLVQGNVGIGTTNPLTALHVVGQTYSTGGFSLNNGQGIQADGYTGLTLQSTNTNLRGQQNVYVSLDSDNNSTSDFFSIQTDSTVAGSGTQLFRVLESGNVGIGTTIPTYKLSVLSSDTTSGLNVTGNSITTGNAGLITANGLTTGNLLSLASTSTALTTGKLLNIDWSPASSITATGDLVTINIGSNGSVGNLFNITDNGSTLFSVSETQITSALPHAFTSVGDVSMASDLNFTNQTASSITSLAPLTIEAGESFENNDLTLKTYGVGNIVADLGTGGAFIPSLDNTFDIGSSTNRWRALYASTLASTTLTVSGLTQGSVTFAGSGGTISQDNANFFWDDTNNRLGIGTSSPGHRLDIKSSGTNTYPFSIEASDGSTLFDILEHTSGTGIANIYGADGTANIVLNAGGTSYFNNSATAALAIGKTSADADLDVYGNIYVGSNSSSNNEIRFYFSRDGYPNIYGQIEHEGNGSGLKITAQPDLVGNANSGNITFFNSSDGTTATEKLRISNTGYIGIGTTNPLAKLNIVASSDDEQLIIKGYSSQTANLQEWQNSSGTTLSYIKPDGSFHFGSGGSSTAGVEITKNTSSTGNSGLAIEYTNTGAVGDAAANSVYAYSRNTTGTQTNFSTNFFNLYHDTAGTVTNLRFVNGRTAVSDGVVTNWNLYDTDQFNQSGGAVTNLRFINIPALNKTGGTLTNQYGIYIADQNDASALNYAIYTNAGKVHFGDTVDFAGNVGIGTTNPTQKLTLSNDSYLAGENTSGIAVKIAGIDTNNILQLGYDAAQIRLFQNIMFDDSNFSNTGSGRGIWSDSNTFGINTYTSDFRIHTGTSTTNRMQISTAGDIYMGNIGTSLNNSVLTVLGSGNVGINNTNPQDKLHVKGGAILLDFNQAIKGEISTGGAFYDLIKLGASNSVHVGSTDRDTQINGNGYLTFATGGTQKWAMYSTSFYPPTDDTGSLGTTTNRIYSAKFGTGGISIGTTANVPSNGLLVLGNVGIGTTAPTAKLQVNGDAGTLIYDHNIKSVDTTALAANNGGGINFVGTYTSAGTIVDYGAGIKALKQNATSGDYSYNLAFWTRQSGSSPLERMRLTYNGNVGIGTTNPSQKLAVAGNIAISPTATIGAGAGYGAVGSAASGYIELYNQGSGALTLTSEFVGINAGINFQTGGANTRLRIGPTGDFYFNTSQMLLQASTGNFSIGNTIPSAKLHVFTGADATIGQIIQANSATQSGNLQEFRTSAGTIMGRFTLADSGTSASFSVGNTSKAILSGDTSSGTGTSLELQNSTTNRWQLSTNVYGGFYITRRVSSINTPFYINTSSDIGLGGNISVYDQNLAGSKMVIKADTGYVGIGISSPISTLHIAGGDLTIEGTRNIDMGATSSIRFSGQTATGMHGISEDTGDLFYGSIGNFTVSFDTDNNNTNAFIVRHNNRKSTGAELFRVDGSGYVGIGASTPLSLLSVGAGTMNYIDGVNDALIAGDLEVDGTIYGNFSGSIVPSGFTQGSVVFAGSGGSLSQDNASFFWDDTNNRLGIGRTDPLSKLDIVGADGLPSTSKGIFMVNSSNSEQALTVGSYYDGTAAGMWLQSMDRRSGINTTKPLYLQPLGGNIGIGTTAPAYTLSVNGAIKGSQYLYLGSATTNYLTIDAPGNDATITQFYDQGTLSLIAGSTAGATRSKIVVASSSSPNISLYTANSERMRIDSSGNVGIGTTNPGAKLEVTGDILFSNGAARTISVQAATSASPNGATLNINGATGGSAATGNGGAVAITGGDSASWGAGDGGAISLIGGMSGQGTGRSGGAITIAGGPGNPAGSTNGGAISISGGAGEGFSYGGNVSIVSGESKTNGYSSGNLVLGTGNIVTGSYGTITFKQGPYKRMTIDASGRIGIGVSDPTNLLDIAGGVKIGSLYAGGSKTAPSNGLLVQGNVGIGISNPTGILHVVGANESGSGITLTAGTGTNVVNAAGGAVAISGGAATGTNGAGGPITLTGGLGILQGAGGAVTISGGGSGSSAGTGGGGAINIVGGAGNAASQTGGAINLTGGTASTGIGGALNLASGTGYTGGALALTIGTSLGTNANGGALSITSGQASTNGNGTGGTLSLTSGAGNGANTGGPILITGGAGGSTNANGGSLYLVGGTAGGSGSAGNVLLAVTSAGVAQGNVGIGTTRPSTLLHLYGSTAPNIKLQTSVTAANTAVGTISMYNSTNEVGRIDVVSNDSSQDDGHMRFFTATNGATPTEKMRIDRQGSLMVGPLSSLGAVEALMVGSGNQSGTDLGLYYDVAGGSDRIVLQTLYKGGNDGDFEIRHVNTSGTNTSLMYIDSSAGYVGIGTTTPAGGLDVASTVFLRGAATAGQGLQVASDGDVSVGSFAPYGKFSVAGSSNSTLGATTWISSGHEMGITSFIYNSSTTMNSYSGLRLGNRDSGASFWGMLSVSQGTGISDLVFGNNTSEEVMRIKSSGYMGIGTSAPLSLLSVGNGTMDYIDGVNDALIAGDLEVDGTIYGNFSGSIVPSGFTQGSVVFAGSGGSLSQDNASFFWDDTNDRLGIGTTAPGTKFEISDGNDGMGATISAKDGGAILMAVNGTYPLQIGNNTDGANSVRFKIAGNGNILAGDAIYGHGETAPQYSFMSDIDSGLFNLNNNIVGIATGGVSRLYVNATGNVGIGTTAPDELLYLSKASTNGSTAIRIDNTATGGRDWSLRSGAGATSIGNGNFAIYDHTASASRLTINPSGYIGIGTTNPTEKLQITNGNILLKADSGSNPYIILGGNSAVTTEGLKLWYENNTGMSYLDSIFNSDTSGIKFRTKTGATPVEAMTILGSGNVGIGTTNPVYKMDILQATNNSRGLNVTNSGAGTTSYGIYSAQTGSATTGYGGYFTSSVGGGNTGVGLYASGSGTTSTSIQALLPQTGGAGGMVDTAIQILSGGGGANSSGTITNYGLKIDYSAATPPSGTGILNSYAAHISVPGTNTGGSGVNNYGLYLTGTGGTGSSNFSLYNASTLNSYFAGNIGIGTTAPTSSLTVVGATGEVLKLSHATGFAGLAIQGGQSGDATYSINSGYPNAGDFSIRENNVDNRLVIKKTTGNVGIGTTNPRYKLEIRGGNSSLGAAAYLDNSKVLSYSGSNLQIGNTVDWAGGLSLFGGTTEALKILTSGNVGIGTTNPTVALDVAGLAAINQTLTMSYVGDGATDGIIGYDGNKTGTATFSLQRAVTGATGTRLYGYNGIGFSPSTATGNNYKMVILNSGNIGMGSTAPTNLLDVAGGVKIGTSYAGSATTAPSSGLLVEGRVGIGTATPDYTLQVVGDFRAGLDGTNRYSSISNLGLLTARYDDNGLRTVFNLENRDPATGNEGVNIGFILERVGGSGGISAGAMYLQKEQPWTSTTSTQDAYLAFSTALNGTATEKLRINSSGYVGIGTTSPFFKLDVVGPGGIGISSGEWYWGRLSNGVTHRIAGVTTSNVLRIGEPTNNVPIWLQTNNSSLYLSATSENVGIGTTNPTNTLDIAGGVKIGAGYAGSATTAPSSGLLVEGKVGIGTTNPTYKLDVIGSGKFSSSLDEFTIQYRPSTIDNEVLTAMKNSKKAGIYLPNTYDAGWKNLLISAKSSQYAPLTEWQNIAGTGLMVVSATGSLGIGTTAPTNLLDVAGGVKIGAGYAGSATTAPASGLLVQGNVGLGTTAPSSALHVSGGGITVGSRSYTLANGDILTSGGLSLGNGSVGPLSNSILDVVHTHTGTSLSGTRLLHNVNPTVASQTYYGTFVVSRDISTNSTGITNLSAFRGVAQQLGSGTISELASFSSASAQSNVAGTVTSMYGLLDDPTVAGTVTNRYGVYIKDRTGSGILSKNYGIYIDTLSTGTSANFAIYSAGSTNYFGGNVGIGTTNPSNLVEIATNTGTTVNVLRLTNVGQSIATGVGLEFYNATGQAEQIAQIYADVGSGYTNNSLNIQVQHSAEAFWTFDKDGSMWFSNNTNNKVIGLVRQFAANLPGRNLTVSAGGTAASQTNQNGGNLFLASGLSTGTGGSNIYLQTSGAGVSGTSDNALVTAMTITSTRNVGVGTTAPTNLLDIAGGVKIGTSYAGSATTAPASGLLVEGRVGIGTTAPGQQLEITKNFKLPLTTATAGTIYQGNSSFIHTYADPTSDGSNMFIGITSGNFTMSPDGGASSLASNNTGIGYGVLRYNTTGWRNTAIGVSAMQSNTTGDHNIALGQNALLSNQTGVYNTALGIDALHDGLAASYNVAIGQNALLALDSTGSPNGLYNLAVGYNVAPAATSAYNNVVLGANAMTALTSGFFNTAVGYGALNGVTTRYSNTALGYSAGPNTANVLGGVFIGYGAGYYETGNNTLYIDNATRASTADGRTKALVYGIFDAAVANQYLTINGQLRVTGTGNSYINGNVGIGTTAPTNLLDIAGGVKIGAGYAGMATTAPASGLLIECNVGIGMTKPGSKLSIADLGSSTGTTLIIDANGNVFKDSSSLRYKKDVTPLSTDWSKLLQLNPVSYKYIDTDASSIGYIAEELDTLGLTDLVMYDNEGRPDAIKYDKLTIYLTEILKQQQADINMLKGGTIPETTTTVTSAESSAILAEIQTVYQEFQDFVATLSMHVDAATQTLIVDQDFMVNGSTILRDLTISGDVYAGLIQINTLESSISTTGDAVLKLQSDALAGNIDMFNGKIILDKDGNIAANGIVAGTYTVDSAAETIGNGTIAAGDTEVTINTTAITSSSKVFITATTSTNGETLFISNTDAGHAFTVKIDNSTSSDISFDWWIVEVK